MKYFVTVLLFFNCCAFLNSSHLIDKLNINNDVDIDVLINGVIFNGYFLSFDKTLKS